MAHLLSAVSDPVQHEAGEDRHGLEDLEEPGQGEALIDPHHRQTSGLSLKILKRSGRCLKHFKTEKNVFLSKADQVSH